MGNARQVDPLRTAPAHRSVARHNLTTSHSRPWMRYPTTSAPRKPTINPPEQPVRTRARALCVLVPCGRSVKAIATGRRRGKSGVRLLDVAIERSPRGGAAQRARSYLWPCLVYSIETVGVVCSHVLPYNHAIFVSLQKKSGSPAVHKGSGSVSP